MFPSSCMLHWTWFMFETSIPYFVPLFYHNCMYMHANLQEISLCMPVCSRWFKAIRTLYCNIRSYSCLLVCCRSFHSELVPKQHQIPESVAIWVHMHQNKKTEYYNYTLYINKPINIMHVHIQHTFHILWCGHLLLMLFQDCNHFIPYILMFGNNFQWDLHGLYCFFILRSITLETGLNSTGLKLDSFKNSLALACSSAAYICSEKDEVVWTIYTKGTAWES